MENQQKKRRFLFLLCYSRVYILLFCFVSLLLEEYGVMFGYLKCPKGNYLEFMENTYGITSDGRLKLLPDKLLPQDIYCLDMFVEEQNGICEENLYVLICFPENIEENIR